MNTRIELSEPLCKCMYDKYNLYDIDTNLFLVHTNSVFYNILLHLGFISAMKHPITILKIKIVIQFYQMYYRE